MYIIVIHINPLGRGTRLVHDDGIKILGSVVGSPAFTKQFLTDAVDKIALTTEIPRLHELKTAAEATYGRPLEMRVNVFSDQDLATESIITSLQGKGPRFFMPNGLVAKPLEYGCSSAILNGP